MSSRRKGKAGSGGAKRSRPVPPTTNIPTNHRPTSPPRPVSIGDRLRPYRYVFGAVALAAVLIVAAILGYMQFSHPSATAAAATPSLSSREKLIEAPTPNASGQVVDGIPCQTTEQAAYHVHAHLVLDVNGKSVLVPAGIGIKRPWQTSSDGFIGGGSCLYWLHTHDASGIIHVEAPKQQSFTLGQFFDIWGQPLTSSNVAGYPGKLTVYVNQKPYTGDPHSIELTNHTNITLEVGKVVPPAPNYNFQAAGL